MLTIILVVLGVLVLAAALQKAPIDGNVRNIGGVVILVFLELWLLRRAGVL